MIIINPGSGPVEGATLDHAYENMRKLIEDADLPKGTTFARDVDADEEGGRFAFEITVPGGERFGTISIDMPGIPLDKVRYLGRPQDIWNFPRLYVDGSSWVWCFAVNRVREWLKENEEHEEEQRKEALAARREREGSPSEGSGEGG